MVNWEEKMFQEGIRFGSTMTRNAQANYLLQDFTSLEYGSDFKNSFNIFL